MRFWLIVVGRVVFNGCSNNGKGKPWSEEEMSLLLAMVNQGSSPQEIYDSGKFPDRTYEAIRKQAKILKKFSGIVETKPTTIVEIIEPAQQAMSMDRVVKLFTTALDQICVMNEPDKLALERFRIIFQAAKDYGPLLAGYEKWEKIEKQIEGLAAAVAELQAAKGIKKTA